MKLLLICLLAACTPRVVDDPDNPKRKTSRGGTTTDEVPDEIIEEGLEFVEAARGSLSVGTKNSVMLASGAPHEMASLLFMKQMFPQLAQIPTMAPTCNVNAQTVSHIEIAADEPGGVYGFLKGPITAKDIACMTNGKVHPKKKTAVRVGQFAFYEVKGGMVFANERFPKQISPPARLTRLIGTVRDDGFALAILGDDQMGFVYRIDQGQHELMTRFADEAGAQDMARDLAAVAASLPGKPDVKSDGGWVSVSGKQADVGEFFRGLVRNGGMIMLPNLMPGDVALVVPTPVSNLQQGMIVGVKTKSGTVVLRRLIGLPGETIDFACEKMQINSQPVSQTHAGRGFVLGEPTGKMFATGRVYEEELGNSRHELLERGCESPAKQWKLGADEYFVLGDNRSYKKDSRKWGAIKQSHIVGVARLVLFGEKGTRFSAKRAKLLR